MSFSRGFAVSLVLFTLACGSSHSFGDAGPDAHLSESDAGAPEPDAGPPAESCLDACEFRRSGTPSTSGWCEFSECAAECAAVRGMSEAAELAVEACLRDNPLCFETLDSCVLSRLHAETIPVPVTLVAEGLAEWEGRQALAHVRTLGETSRLSEVEIRGGGFSLDVGPVDFEVRGGQLPSVEGFVDVDGDGRCGAGDVPFREFSERVGGFDAPAYEARLSGRPEGDFSFICERL